MSASNGETPSASNRSQHTNGNPNTERSTLPGPGHCWQVNLQDKVIASKSEPHFVGIPLVSLSLTMKSVTGANQGIGLGIAEVCLANNAACIYSLDISSPGEPFAALAKKFPGKLEYLQADVTDETSVAAALDAIVSAKGRFDGMVANAGATKHQPALEFTA